MLRATPLSSRVRAMRALSDDPIIEEYARLASNYDTRWPVYVDASIRETIAILNLKPDQRVLHVGCGTGALLNRLALLHPTLQLFGVDKTAEILAVASCKLSPAVGLSRGSAECLPYGDQQFDAVISSSVFHYIRQPIVALREMRRVLRVGRQLVITDWCIDNLACRVYDLYLRACDRAYIRSYGKQEFLHLLWEVGFVDVRIVSYRISWFWGLMTASAIKSALADSAGSRRFEHLMQWH